MDTYNYITSALRVVTMVIFLHTKALAKSTKDVISETAFNKLKRVLGGPIKMNKAA